jgi:HD-GYP domain-containing protein (c-di-GMP phosphodiesterase class II)
MTDEATYQVLLIGLEPKVEQVVKSACEGASFVEIVSAEQFAANFETWQDGMFNGIICGPQVTGMSAYELAQVLLNQCPMTVKFYVTSNTDNWEPRNLIKNGFNQAYALPMDGPLFRKAILESILSGAKKQKSFRSVRVFDIGGGDQLEFETYVYLPLNKKYVRFTGVGQQLSEQKLEKLQSREMSQVFVDHKDMGKFYQYSARRLRELGDQGVSSTEKQEKLKDCVRGLFSDIFDQSIKADFDKGREMISNAENIISNYITKGASSKWYQKLLSSIGESNDTYNHASNVSTFAALFAIGIGHPHPEDLAMAGLFHDLGCAGLPEDLLAKAEAGEPLTENEKSLYYTHPEKSVNFVKNKRLILTPPVERAILQHHEAWTGKGFPKQLPPARISEEAQILSFADQFDYLTRLKEGHKRLTPLEALETIRRNGSINPELVSRLRRLFEREAGASRTA